MELRKIPKLRSNQVFFGDEEENIEVRDNQVSYINIAKIYRSLKRGASSIKKRTVRYTREIFPSEYDQIRIGMKKNQREGFAFHQHEVQKDIKLLEWVLRENYLGENGKLPE